MELSRAEYYCNGSRWKSAGIFRFIGLMKMKWPPLARLTQPEIEAGENLYQPEEFAFFRTCVIFSGN
jgi:hypothetical protein